MRILVAVSYGDPIVAKLAREVQSAAVHQIAAMLKQTAPEAPDWMLSAAAQFVLSGLHAIALWRFDNKAVKTEGLVELIAAICWAACRR